MSERGIALNKGEVVSRTRNCMVCVLIVVLSLLGCGQEVMPIDEGLQGNVKKEISEYLSKSVNRNVCDKEEIPEKHQVNRQELEITYVSQDGIDPMRAMHRSISVGGNIYLTYNEEDGYYIPIGETGQLPLGLENSKGLHVCNVTADVYGRLSFLMSNEDYNKWYIWQLDEENQVKNEIDISEYCKTKYIPNWFLVDKDGYYYLQWPMDRTGMVLDNGGVMLHRTSPQSLGVDWIYEAAVGKSGNIYILYGDEIQGKQFGKLELMNASLQMTKSELVLPEDEVITLAGAGTDTELLLFSPYSGIWAYDDENEILENRVPLSEITNGQNKEYLPLVFLEDGRLVMLAQVDNSDTEKEAEFSMRYIPAGK